MRRLPASEGLSSRVGGSGRWSMRPSSREMAGARVAPAGEAASAGPRPVRWWRGSFTLLAPLLLFGAADVAGVVLCPLRNATGVPCPGCGLTRATWAVLRGDWAEAARLHPLVFVLSPLVAWVWGGVAWRAAGLPVRLRRGSPAARRWRRRGLWGLLVASLVVWVLRFAGWFGGPVDPVDLARGWLTRWFV